MQHFRENAKDERISVDSSAYAYVCVCVYMGRDGRGGVCFKVRVHARRGEHPVAILGL